MVGCGVIAGKGQYRCCLGRRTFGRQQLHLAGVGIEDIVVEAVMLRTDAAILIGVLGNVLELVTCDRDLQEREHEQGTARNREAAFPYPGKCLEAFDHSVRGRDCYPTAKATLWGVEIQYVVPGWVVGSRNDLCRAPNRPTDCLARHRTGVWGALRLVNARTALRVLD